jgi:hypothetical protein
VRPDEGRLYHHVRRRTRCCSRSCSTAWICSRRSCSRRSPTSRIAPACARRWRNVELVTVESSKESIILHEHQTATGAAALASTSAEALRGGSRGSFRGAIDPKQIREVDPTLATFSFLGVVLWTYKWYRSDGSISAQTLSDGMIDLFFRGLLP